MKQFITLLMCLLVMMPFGGCSSWQKGSYVSVTPHAGNHTGTVSAEQQASSYPQLRKALVNLVQNGADEGVIFLYDLSDEVVHSYMDAAVRYLTTEDPVGVYAVDEITYEVGMNAGRYALAVHIAYSRSRSEILQIKYVGNIAEATEAIGDVLELCGNAIVLRIEEYEPTDFVHLVQSYAQRNANVIMETPQVMTAVYPESGDSRLISLTFTYQTEQETLLKMQELVRPVFLSAELYVQGASSDRGKLSQLYSFLMERHDYTYTSSPTPAYSVLQEGKGDCYAFACVYAGMCTQAGLDCTVVSGTRNGETWYWNLITLDDSHYHVDLLRSNQTGMFQLYRDSDLLGYSWNAELYSGGSEN